MKKINYMGLLVLGLTVSAVGCESPDTNACSVDDLPVGKFIWENYHSASIDVETIQVFRDGSFVTTWSIIDKLAIKVSEPPKVMGKLNGSACVDNDVLIVTLKNGNPDNSELRYTIKVGALIEQLENGKTKRLVQQ